MKLKEWIKAFENNSNITDTTRIMVYVEHPDIVLEPNETITVYYGSYGALVNDKKVCILYGDREITSWNILENGVFIVIDGECYAEDQKFYFNVGTFAEGDSRGRVRLTLEQAKIIEYATDKGNWENYDDDGYSGSFFIDIDHPVPISDT